MTVPNADDDPCEPTWKMGDNGHPDPTSPRDGNGGPLDGEFSVDNDSDRSIGRYQLLDRLGRGGFGIVYRAEDQVLKRHVALKLLTRFPSPSEVDAWLEEGRMLAGLDHPAIVPVFDVGKTDEGQPFIVSKLILGGPLDRRVGNHDWSFPDTVRVIAQLARALDYLHRRGVIHRDVKPGNILTTPDGNAVLADFGLAMPESAYGRGARFVGTPAYMSPEQARHEGHRVDGRSDIYSLGVVFYELLTGKRPFQATERDQLLDCIRNVEVRPPRQLDASIPRELERICMKALSKKISDRYSTANDFAEDLEQWQQGEADTQAVLKPREQLAAPPQSASARSIELETIAVVPHGLRPFDANDTDFFRFLVPGPRDRFGVPESIRFWTNSILSREPDACFRVGVLLGPSGSGKSSLIRAGVLPLVEKDVSVVYVEAKPDALENLLSKQMRQVAEDRGNSGELVDQVTAIRQAGGTRERKKLLLVIDQFEQWLNHHRLGGSSVLRDALRQCDGVTVQAILIVRDDFVLGISSFMDEVEESMQQNTNFATVEPFGAAHALHVLAAFGRAYGAVDDPPSAPQKAFLEEAIREFETAGRIDPLQIALLSEMTKGKPWSIATLKDMGGIQGLGIAFLDERLGGPSAHPMLRTHPEVVRRLLGEFLPTDNTIIKPPAILESELLERVTGSWSEETIRKILQLLDTEVRLITPTSSMRTTGNSQSGSSTSDPAYQLTHDYLVPTTRAWLSLHQSQTRAGRVREQLREIAATWNAKPSRKRLPTMAEWLAIRWFTHSKHWTASERRMMRVCDRRILRYSLLSLMAIGLIGFSAVVTTQRAYARSLANSLQEIAPEDVGEVLEKIDRYRGTWMYRWIGLPAPDLSEEESKSSRSQLRTALALSNVSGENANFVCSHLGEVEDRYLKGIVAYVAKSARVEEEDLFVKTQQALQDSSPNALPLAAVAAMRQTASDRWSKLAPAIVEQLLQRPATQVGYWTEMFQPIRTYLVPPLIDAGQRLHREKNNQVDTARALVSTFAKDDAEALAKAATWVGVEGIEPLLRDSTVRDRMAVEARALLMRMTSAPYPFSEVQLDPTLVRKVTDLGGVLHTQGGWTESVPLDSVASVVDGMRDAGYVPMSIRPYTADNHSLAALTWKQGAVDVEYVLGCSQEELETKFEALQSAGWTMIDFASLRDSDPGSRSYRWVGLWHRDPNTPSVAQTLQLGVSHEATVSQPSEGSDPVQEVAVRYAVRLDERGDLIHDALSSAVTSEMRDIYDESADDSATWSRISASCGDLYPGLQRSDVRSFSTANTLDRGNAWDEYYYYWKLCRDVPLDQLNVKTVANLASRLLECGQEGEAAEWLQKIASQDVKSIRSAVLRLHATILAKSNDADKLRDLIQSDVEPSDMPEYEKCHLRLRLAVLVDHPDEAMEQIRVMETQLGKSPRVEDRILRSLALVASKDWGNDTATQAMLKLKKYAKDWLASQPSLRFTFLESDFDGLQNDPNWKASLEGLRLDARISGCSHFRPGLETTDQLDVPAAEHRSVSIRLLEEGYTPSVIDVRVRADGKRNVSSVWVRAERKSQDLSERADSIAALAISLAYCGQPDALMDGLRDKWGRSVRTAIIARAPAILAPRTIVDWFQTETIPSQQAAIMEMLGSIAWSRFDDTSRKFLQARATDLATTSPDARLNGTARWCCRAWSLAIADPVPNIPLDPMRNWFTNSQGQPFVRLVVPDLVVAGKPGKGRMWKQVGRTIAMATTEATGEQFQDFLADPQVRKWINSDPSTRQIGVDQASMPQRKVSWEMAVRFCQWLNEKESVPEDQWCYKEVWSSETDLQPTLNYLQKGGYRLPTQHEWKYACAAGSTEAWHFGSDQDACAMYEWTLPHSGNRTHAVATLRPNGFGLFDMGGNLAEWCDNAYREPIRSVEHYFAQDDGNPSNRPMSQNRLLAGGRFRFGAQSAISDSMVLDASDYLSVSTGFRVVKTIAEPDRIIKE